MRISKVKMLLHSCHGISEHGASDLRSARCCMEGIVIAIVCEDVVTERWQACALSADSEIVSKLVMVLYQIPRH
jgi:hypothetical protein